MPLWDWQFVVVTLIAAGALWMIVRRLVPSRAKTTPDGKAAAAPASPACAHCASNATNGTPSRQPSRTTTVPVVALRDLRRQGEARQHTGPRH